MIKLLSRNTTILRWVNPSAFFFNDTATTEIYTLSLHDALPIFDGSARVQTVSASDNREFHALLEAVGKTTGREMVLKDRKSTRLNSSHSQISYAVFCLKKNKNFYRFGVITSHSIVHHDVMITSR